MPRTAQPLRSSPHKTWVFVACLGVPLTARANGIDLPVLLGVGLGIILPLLLLNATIEAPILGRILGLNFSDVWYPWFKANAWSLLSGIPALMINSALADWLLPTSLGPRFRVYPFFLPLCLVVYFGLTWLVEFLYARRLVRKEELSVPSRRVMKAVLVANLASYAVLGPVFLILQYPKSEIREFTPNATWSKNPYLVVVANVPGKGLMAATANGQYQRDVMPHETREFVVSRDLKQVLYRGEKERFYFFNGDTNIPIPELGFSCRAPEMDFSPGGRYAAFFNHREFKIRVYDFSLCRFRDVPVLGTGYDYDLAWSTNETLLYLRVNKATWEIALESQVAYRQLEKTPVDFAEHYGRMGPMSNWEGARYAVDEQGDWKIMLRYWAGSSLMIFEKGKRAIHLKDPAGQLGADQAVFLESPGEALLGFAGHVYVLDLPARRLGLVMAGEEFVGLTKKFSKQLNF